MLLAAAVEFGLGPCKICKSPVVVVAIPFSNKKPEGTGKIILCKGITKAGVRCKHMTSIASDYCFQHPPSM